MIAILVGLYRSSMCFHRSLCESLMCFCDCIALLDDWIGQFSECVALADDFMIHLGAIAGAACAVSG